MDLKGTGRTGSKIFDSSHLFGVLKQTRGYEAFRKCTDLFMFEPAVVRSGIHLIHVNFKNPKHFCHSWQPSVALLGLMRLLNMGVWKWRVPLIVWANGFVFSDNLQKKPISNLPLGTSAFRLSKASVLRWCWPIASKWSTSCHRRNWIQ